MSAFSKRKIITRSLETQVQVVLLLDTQGQKYNPFMKKKGVCSSLALLLRVVQVGISPS